MEFPAKVLIVDDEERNRKLLRALVESEGYRTLEAASGREALALAGAEFPAVILLDLMMPGMDGFETAKRLKADASTQHIPIAIVTALDDPSARMRALASGAEEVLLKPVDRWELSARLRNLVKLRDCMDRLRQLEAERPAFDATRGGTP